MTDLVVKGIYSFNVYPVARLGTNFANVTIVGEFDDTLAKAQGFDTAAEHAAVYNTLPAGTPNDPSAYNYVKIRLPNGQTQILGIPWIIANSIEVVNLGTITVKISNVNSSDTEKVRKALAANGFNAADISFA